VHRGREAVLTDLAAQGEVWESQSATPREIIPAGDKVVVFVDGTGTGKASGAEVRIDVVHVWTLKGGKVTRIEAFLDPGAAMRAAGLEAGVP
jgi:ketosteroid isomerase-like protein